MTGQDGSVGRRKISRHPHEGTERPAKPKKTLYRRRKSACRPAKSYVPPRALEEPVRGRRDLPRSRPRAVRIGPGKRSGPPRTAPERSKSSRERPEAGQETPGQPPEPSKSRQDRPKSRPGALPERSWRPSGTQLPPKSLRGYFGSLGARFQTLRGPLGEASAAECAPFRGALAIASRPFHSTAPEVQKS